ncbi:hypothetical protein B296_00050968 [Ensete ventricosum]|uniref:Uncharacterized protein n=1 Tax=Ensete ventricosum TaxID=4639 RepID=A0A426XP69_ENSVE|nr:hypothetical protein B296_00050968 [Ensete ventricosum]
MGRSSSIAIIPLPSPFSSPLFAVAAIAVAPSSSPAPTVGHHLPFSSIVASVIGSLALSRNHHRVLLTLTPLPPPSSALSHHPTTATNRCPTASTVPRTIASSPPSLR